MMKMPRDTYTFSHSTRGNDPGNNEDLTMEFEGQEIYLDELLEKFQRFLVSCGYCLDGMEIQAVPVDEDDHSHCNHDEQSNNPYKLGQVTYSFDGLQDNKPK